MENNSPDLLTDSFLSEGIIPRKKLLPLWIKIFAWLFLITAVLMPFLLIGGIITHSFSTALYGLEADTLYSEGGVFVVILFVFKGVTAFGLLKQKDWAIKFGIADAILGVIICCGVMVYGLINQNHFSFRLELIALIPYLLKLLKIKGQWESIRLI